MSSASPIETQPSAPTMEEEISREQAMQNLLTMEEICDLTLKGSDGVLVPANRGMLAARSLVFRSMLFGNFSEATSSAVSVGYEGSVIRAVVEYIYTDKCTFFTSSEESLSAESVAKLIHLLEAARYYGLKKLYQIAEKFICSKMKEQSGLACAALVVCENLPDGVASFVKTSARQVVQSQAADLLGGGSDYLMLLTPSLLESILQDDKMEADEYTLFLLLQKWGDGADEERFAAAANLTKYISLDCIAPSELSTTVQESGLVTAEELNVAYKKQALRSEKWHCLAFKKRRFHRAVWETSRDIVFAGEGVRVEKLDCPVMISGVHKWTIKVEGIAAEAGLGVASVTTPPSSRRWLGQDQGGWALYTSGRRIHGDGDYIRSGLKFKVGSLVSMELDLREADGGKLSASVNGGPSLLLFSDMLRPLQQQIPQGGFIPAVSFLGTGKVRLIEMTEAAE